MSIVTVPWTPKTKDRPRVVNRVAYTPKTTRDAETAVRAAFIEAATEEGVELPFSGPIAVKLLLSNDSFDVEIVPCAEHTQRKLRGDIDNYAKLILDALNGVAFFDDRQIVRLGMEKR